MLGTLQLLALPTTVAEGMAATPTGAHLVDTAAGADEVVDMVAAMEVAVPTVEVVDVVAAEAVAVALVGMNPSATGTTHQRSLRRLAQTLALKCSNALGAT
jgi:hypothetical protein